MLQNHSGSSNTVRLSFLWVKLYNVKIIYNIHIHIHTQDVWSPVACAGRALAMWLRLASAPSSLSAWIVGIYSHV